MQEKGGIEKGDGLAEKKKKKLYPLNALYLCIDRKALVNSKKKIIYYNYK